MEDRGELWNLGSLLLPDASLIPGRGRKVSFSGFEIPYYLNRASESQRRCNLSECCSCCTLIVVIMSLQSWVDSALLIQNILISAPVSRFPALVHAPHALLYHSIPLLLAGFCHNRDLQGICQCRRKLLECSSCNVIVAVVDYPRWRSDTRTMTSEGIVPTEKRASEQIRWRRRDALSPTLSEQTEMVCHVTYFTTSRPRSKTTGYSCGRKSKPVRMSNKRSLDWIAATDESLLCSFDLQRRSRMCMF